MTRDQIVSLLHHDNSSFPSVCPFDMANALDTGTHWLAKELHRIMGCLKFWKYKTIFQVSCNEERVNSGEFPPSVGLFAAIPKAKCSLPLDWTTYHCLDVVHMDIAFGNCLSVGNFHNVLILVDCATQYNWTFGLNISVLITSLEPCASSMLWLVPLHIAFTATVTPS
jgi:hypothetical protein